MKWERITEIIEALTEDDEVAANNYPATEIDEAREWEDVISSHGEEIAEAAHDLDVQPSDVDEAYAGQFSSDEAFTQDLVDQLGLIPKDLPSFIHIDWEATARDVMMDYGEHNGYYFRSL